MHVYYIISIRVLLVWFPSSNYTAPAQGLEACLPLVPWMLAPLLLANRAGPDPEQGLQKTTNNLCGTEEMCA